jgi:ketosteroid isomerase-like protein
MVDKMSETVEKAFENYEIGLSRQSWDAVKDYFHEDCAVIFIEANYLGKNAIKRAIDKTFSLIRDEKFILFNKHWSIKREDFASVIFEYEWSGKINGEIFRTLGRGTAVLIKENDRWQIINEHLGPMPR